MFSRTHGARNIALALVAVCFSVFTLSLEGAVGNISNLGTLGGLFTYGQGRGVNATGQVAGYSYAMIADMHAFRYDGTPGIDGIMRDLGTLGGTTSSANSLNVFGQVAGASDIAGNGERHAFRYDGTPGAGGVMLDLGTLGGTQSAGVGINAAGQVVGSSSVPGSQGMHAFRYDGTPGIDGVMHDLGNFGNLPQSSAFSINDAGQVAGYSVAANGLEHAFRYDGTPGIDGTMLDLGTLGGEYSKGYGINNSGQVVGESTTLTGLRAFRYDGTPGVDGVMHDLGTLGGASHAFAINSSGVAVGFADRLDGGSSAAIWRADLTIVDLDAWLDSVNPTLGAHWKLGIAFGINDRGLVTGFGDYIDGPGAFPSTVPFLLDASSLIPEPGALALIAPTILLLRRSRRRH